MTVWEVLRGFVLFVWGLPRFIFDKLAKEKTWD